MFTLMDFHVGHDLGWIISVQFKFGFIIVVFNQDVLKSIGSNNVYATYVSSIKFMYKSGVLCQILDELRYLPF